MPGEADWGKAVKDPEEFSFCTGPVGGGGGVAFN